MLKSIGIVVADDHPLFRGGVIRTLQSQPGFDVLGEASTAEEAVEMVGYCKPEIALIDISMPGSGIKAAEKIASLPNPPKTIMLTASEAEDDIIASLKAGASGYVLKGISSEELINVVQSVYAGETYIPPTLGAQALMALSNPEAGLQTAGVLIGSLNARETDILKLVAIGRSNKEVGLELDIQEKTVKHYMTAIMQKLRAKNRVEAALRAHDAWGAASGHNQTLER